MHFLCVLKDRKGHFLRNKAGWTKAPFFPDKVSRSCFSPDLVIQIHDDQKFRISKVQCLKFLFSHFQHKIRVSDNHFGRHLGFKMFHIRAFVVIFEFNDPKQDYTIFFSFIDYPKIYLSGGQNFLRLRIVESVL